MKYIICSVFIILGVVLNSFAQINDSILVKTGRKYMLNGQEISKKKVKNMYSAYPVALKEYKIGKTYKATGKYLTLGGLAYVVVGSQVVRIQRENDYTDWFNSHTSGTFDDSKYPKKLLINAGIGIGISGIGLICLISAPDHFKKAVNLFNSKHTTGFNSNSQYLEFGLTPNGLGLAYRF